MPVDGVSGHEDYKFSSKEIATNESLMKFDKDTLKNDISKIDTASGEDILPLRRSKKLAKTATNDTIQRYGLPTQLNSFQSARGLMFLNKMLHLYIDKTRTTCFDVTYVDLFGFICDNPKYVAGVIYEIDKPVNVTIRANSLPHPADSPLQINATPTPASTLASTQIDINEMYVAPTPADSVMLPNLDEWYKHVYAAWYPARLAAETAASDAQAAAKSKKEGDFESLRSTNSLVTNSLSHVGKMTSSQESDLQLGKSTSNSVSNKNKVTVKMDDEAADGTTTSNSVVEDLSDKITVASISDKYYKSIEFNKKDTKFIKHNFDVLDEIVNKSEDWRFGLAIRQVARKKKEIAQYIASHEELAGLDGGKCITKKRKPHRTTKTRRHHAT
jgi:hypothetical protein